MPPMLVLTDVRRKGRRIRLWVPLFLIWLLLLPVAVLLFPVFIVLCLAFGREPLAAMDAVYDLLSGLTGTVIEIDTPRAFVFIRFV